MLRALIGFSVAAMILCIATIIFIFAANGYKFKQAADFSEYTGLGTTISSLTAMILWLLYVDLGKSRQLAEVMRELVLPIGACLLAASFGFIAYCGILCRRGKDEDLGIFVDKEL